jgi:hypothetical protein
MAAALSSFEDRHMLRGVNVTGVGRRMGVVLLSLWGLVACGSPTKEDLIARSRDVSTRADLEKALGQPSDITKVGPVEQWTYKARNGAVVFVILGDTVTLQVAGEERKKP